MPKETDSTLNIGMWLPQPDGDAVPTDCAACGAAIGNCQPDRDWLCDKCYVEETSRISTARIAELERLLLAAQNRIGDLCMLVGNIGQCRAVEGDSVTILCDNPEADGIETQGAVEALVELVLTQARYELQRFYGKTWEEAIAKAARVAQRHYTK